jgi:hypothetical protein
VTTRMSPPQRVGARGILDDALAVADGWPGFVRENYRRWVATPSESLRKLPE